ncbi:MAG TPA: PEGA domain-containing protein [Bryobacteraceae bacterium]|nr:PEGA domain-containing protein [Bryobacteraceae bacterium]
MVRFTSNPSRAEVDIDGEYWGTTPTEDLIRLPEGQHTIAIKKTGYETWDRKITLAPGDNRTIAAELILERNDGTRQHIVGLD